MIVPRFKNRHRLAKLTDEVTKLRGQIVEQEIYSTAKDESWREFVNKSIDRWNAAIRATNGPRRGETRDSYERRITEENKGYEFKPFRPGSNRKPSAGQVG